MFFAKYILKDRINKLGKLEKQIKETQEEFDIELQRTYANIYDVRLALEECVSGYSKSTLYNLMLNMVKQVNRDLGNVTTAIELKEKITSILDLFDDFNYQEHYNSDLTYSYLSLSNIRGVDTLALTPLEKEIEKATRDVSLFEPACSTGDSFQYLANEKLKCYGIEATNDASRAKEYATKVVRGEIKGSRIKNDAFDFVIAKCNIYPTLNDNMKMNAIAKQEKDFMYNINRYLRPGGIVLFVIPHYRVYKDIAEHLAKSYDNIKVYKSTGAYWQEKKYVYIYGQKARVKGLNEESYEALRKCYNPDLLEELPEDLNLGYNLPSKYIDIDLFRGSVLDMEELHHLVNNSGAMDDFFESQKIEKIGESSTKPLLPFNIGQLGLVLTSGCLDGVIDEGDGHYHLVKGKVSKKSEVEGSVSDGVLEESETISNRVEINVMLPNGEFKTLT